MLNKFHGYGIRKEEYEKKEKFRKKKEEEEEKEGEEKRNPSLPPRLTGRLELFSIINQCHASLVVAVESATRTTFTMTDDVQNYLLSGGGGEMEVKRRRGKKLWPSR